MIDLKKEKIELDKQYRGLVDRYNSMNKNVELLRSELLRVFGALRFINEKIGSENGKELKLRENVEIREVNTK